MNLAIKKMQYNTIPIAFYSFTSIVALITITMLLSRRHHHHSCRRRHPYQHQQSDSPVLSSSFKLIWRD